MNDSLPPLYYEWRLVQLPSGIWRADGRANVTQSRFSLGTRDRDEAITNLIRLDAETAVRNGLIPAAMLGDQRPLMSIDEACDKYIHWVEARVVPEGLSPETPRAYARRLRNFQKFCQQENVAAVGGITGLLVNRFLTSLAANYMPSYLASHADIVKMLVAHLIDEGVLPHGSAIQSKVSRPRTSTRHCFTEPEVRAILKYCRESSAIAWLHPLIAILAYTGMRVGEALSLRWNDFDFMENKIDLMDERFDAARKRMGAVRRLKGKRSRTIPLHHELRAILESQSRHDDGYVVHTPQGERPRYNDVYLPFVHQVLAPLAEKFPTPLGAAVGFIDGRFHSFRHFFCSISHDLGLAEHQVMAILGHSESEMVRRYYHPRLTVAQQVLGKLSLGN